VGVILSFNGFSNFFPVPYHKKFLMRIFFPGWIILAVLLTTCVSTPSISNPSSKGTEVPVHLFFSDKIVILEKKQRNE